MFQIDYFERAKRLEEIPLIKKAYEEQRVKDMELWELQEEERVRVSISTVCRDTPLLGFRSVEGKFLHRRTCLKQSA